MRVIIYKARDGLQQVLIRPKLSKGLPLMLLEGIKKGSVREAVTGPIGALYGAKP